MGVSWSRRSFPFPKPWCTQIIISILAVFSDSTTTISIYCPSLKRYSLNLPCKTQGILFTHIFSLARENEVSCIKCLFFFFLHVIFLQIQRNRYALGQYKLIRGIESNCEMILELHFWLETALKCSFAVPPNICQLLMGTSHFALPAQLYFHWPSWEQPLSSLGIIQRMFSKKNSLCSQHWRFRLTFTVWVCLKSSRCWTLGQHQPWQVTLQWHRLAPY